MFIKTQPYFHNLTHLNTRVSRVSLSLSLYLFSHQQWQTNRNTHQTAHPVNANTRTKRRLLRPLRAGPRDSLLRIPPLLLPPTTASLRLPMNSKTFRLPSAAPSRSRLVSATRFPLKPSALALRTALAASIPLIKVSAPLPLVYLLVHVYQLFLYIFT